jgi:hypothetical protein
MRFRRGARLDPGQVTDVRGRRLGRTGGLAIGGGGLGLGAVLVCLLIALLSGGGGLAPLEDAQVGQGDTRKRARIRPQRKLARRRSFRSTRPFAGVGKGSDGGRKGSEVRAVGLSKSSLVGPGSAAAGECR